MIFSSLTIQELLNIKNNDSLLFNWCMTDMITKYSLYKEMKKMIYD